MTDKINIAEEEKASELFSKLRIPWAEAKEDVWLKVSKRMVQPKVIPLYKKVLRWEMAVAALFIGLLSLSIFMKTYSVSFNSGSNHYASTELPDGSQIDLNVKSTISYKPYWWWAKREVTLDGEAFFQVKKGKAFRVVSTQGTTEVLGTSFTIFARDQNYEVTCVTGKVKVEAAITQHSVILFPAQNAKLQDSGQLEVNSEVNTDSIKSWMVKKMTFTSTPLIDVFKEIEHQYQVKISYSTAINQIYTGAFDRPATLEELLDLICRPFDLKVKKINKQEFQIFQ